MPQRFVPADYDPAELQVLQRAFDVAWAEVADRYSSAENAEEARAILAQAVVAAASEGVANIEQLRDRALAALDDE